MLLSLIDGNMDESNCPYGEFVIDNLGDTINIDYNASMNKGYRTLIILKPEEFKSTLTDDIIINAH